MLCVQNVLSGFLIDENTYYWILSTAAQSFAALIGVVGIFVVYRLQIQEGKIKDAVENARRYIEEDLREHVIDNRDVEDNIYTNEGLIRGLTNTISFFDRHIKIQEGSEKLKLESKKAQYATCLLEIKNQNKSKNKIRNSIRQPMTLLLSLFVVSLSLIPFYDYIPKGIISAVIIGIFLLSIYVVCLIWRIVKVSVAE